MTDKILNEVMSMVRDAGGTRLEVVQGGRHRFVEFDDAAGQRHSLIVHRGGEVKSVFFHSMRSKLRRCGLEVSR